METTTKQWIFNLFFNYNEDYAKADKWREEALVYLKRLFENKARFACVAKDSNKRALMLRGYCNLNSPCSQPYIKKLLGKYSSVKSSYFGDMVNLCRFVHIDRNLLVTGRLPCVGNSNLKTFATDPKLVVKILVDSMDKKDIEAEGEKIITSTVPMEVVN